MHPEENRPLSDKPQFGGSVELIPPVPVMTEFLADGRIRGFPIHQLHHFILETNPENPELKPDLPPDQLTLAYPTATVVLTGWRLDFMLEPLSCGRIARVHAIDALAQMMVEEPWVTRIQVFEIGEPKTPMTEPCPPAIRSQEGQP